MPQELLDRIDEFADEHGYTGRSEVLREGARNLLGEFKDEQLEDRQLTGVITVLFDFETSNAEQRMMTLGTNTRASSSQIGRASCRERVSSPV